jgi:hypothetical protein
VHVLGVQPITLHDDPLATRAHSSPPWLMRTRRHPM